MVDTIAKKYVGQLWLIRAIVNDILGNSDRASIDIKRAYKFDSKNTKSFLEDKTDVKLSIFP